MDIEQPNPEASQIIQSFLGSLPVWGFARRVHVELETDHYTLVATITPKPQFPPKPAKE